jgi:hypothetical protein
VTIRELKAEEFPLLKGVADGFVPVTLDLTSGKWSVTGAMGSPSGVLTAAQLKTIHTALTAVRNVAEQFAVTAAIINGTQTPW